MWSNDASRLDAEDLDTGAIGTGAIENGAIENRAVGNGAADSPVPGKGALFEPSSARSRSGTIAVTTTPQGLPTSIRIDDAALDRDPAVLGTEILRLCQQAAMAAGIRWREELLAAGVERDVVESMKLPKPDDLARAEYYDDATSEAPSSWLRRA